MNASSRQHAWLRARACIATVVVFVLFAYLPAAAGPSAHGPGGDHLGAPGGAPSGGRGPRVEAKSELFELVAELKGGELSILIDYFETNAPVLNAEVTVESGGLSAKATFHSDLGDYAVDDATLLKKLAVPGEHALVFTVTTGRESDLLEATLRTEGFPAADHDTHHMHAYEWVLAGTIGVAVMLLFGWWTHRRRRAATTRAGVGS